MLRDWQAAVGAAQKLCVSITAAAHDLYPKDKKAFWVTVSTETRVVLYIGWFTAAFTLCSDTF